MTLMLSGDQRIGLDQIDSVARNFTPIAIDDQVRCRVRASRKTLEKLVDNGRVIYGVNTSMGGFVDHLVPISMAQKLQENLLNAVATNVGQHLDDTTVRAIMLARIVSLSRGNSAISEEN